MFPSGDAQRADDSLTVGCLECGPVAVAAATVVLARSSGACRSYAADCPDCGGVLAGRIGMRVAMLLTLAGARTVDADDLLGSAPLALSDAALADLAGGS